MKKIISGDQLKNVGYILWYWIIFVIAPFLYIKQSRNFDNISVEVLIYILFIAPFLYFIPYLLAKPKSKLLFIF
jgi:RsiW-degrading membrane proteinase PrsW (M82 family)